MENHGFVYIWFDRKHKRYYVGCHWGFEEDGYICSSRWMRKSFRRRPDDFKRRILKTNILSRRETYIAEQYYFDMIKPEELKTRYYNLCLANYKWGDKSEEEFNIYIEKQQNKKLSEKTKEKIREARKSQVITVSEETKEKIRQSLLGKTHTEERTEKRRGTKRSDECKEKMKVARARQVASKENLEKRANTMAEYWKSEKGMARKAQMRQNFIDNNPKKKLQ